TARRGRRRHDARLRQEHDPSQPPLRRRRVPTLPAQLPMGMPPQGQEEGDRGAYRAASGALAARTLKAAVPKCPTASVGFPRETRQSYRRSVSIGVLQSRPANMKRLRRALLAATGVMLVAFFGVEAHYFLGGSALCHPIRKHITAADLRDAH